MRRRPPRSKPTRSVKPTLERVEQRVLLATFTVTNTADDGSTGSLRWAIGRSNATGGLNTIDFDIAPSGVQSIAITSALPAVTVPVTIDGTTEPGFGPTPVIELNGAGAGAKVDGLDIKAGNTTVKGLAINRFTGEGISLSVAGADTIQQDFLGTDPSGTVAEGNGVDGVLVQVNSNSNTIKGNLISGNTQDGIYLNGQLFAATNPVSSGNLVIGNALGTDVTGTKALGNGQDGIAVQNAPMSTIGGTTAAARNIISGNGTGMELYDNSDGSVIEGNYVGTDITGSVALGNSGTRGGFFNDNLVFRGISNSTIGGTAAGAGNVISGGSHYGIDSFVIGSGNLAIEGNLIGTDATGTKPLGNTSGGIVIAGPSNVTIGGTIAGARNIVSANGGIGIIANNTGLLIQGNFIGTDITGTQALGNRDTGIEVGTTGVTVGGSLAGAGNIIANNAVSRNEPGVRADRLGTPVLSNSIFNNGRFGIDLNGNTSTQPAPVLTSAVSANVVSTVVGSLTAPAGTYYLQFFATPGLDTDGSAEGETLIGTGTVTVVGTSTNFTMNLPSGFAPGSYITATATTSAGGTSQFSTGIIGTGVGNGLGPPTITVGASSPSVLAGSDVTDTFTISNTFAGPDQGVILSDTIPVGTTFVSGTTSIGVPVVFANGVASAAIGMLATNQTVTVSIVLATSIAAIPAFTNLGEVVSLIPPVFAGVKTASVTTAVTPAADLAVAIAGPSAATQVGQNLTYTVTVTNNGPSPATGVTLDDTLPAGVTLVSATPSSGPAATLSNGVLTDNFGALASGASFTLTIVATAGVDSAPSATDSAAVIADEADPDTTNNSASITTDITAVADVSVALASSTRTLGVGGTLTYTVTVTNDGPSPATGVLLADALPAGVTFVSASASTGPAPTQSSGMVTDAIGPLDPGGRVVIKINVIPTASAVPLVTDVAAVSANEYDPKSSNNTALVVTAVTPVADLAIVGESALPSPVADGQPVTITIVAANNGPSSATGVTLTDVLPAGLTFVSGSVAGGTVGASGGVVTALLGTLVDGGSSVVTIVAMATVVGTFADQSSITSPVTDPVPGNNMGGIPIVVTPLADVSVVLSGTPGPSFTDGLLTYTAVVTNNGPSTATNVVFTDPLFPGASFQSVEANQVNGAVVNGVVTQALGSLAPGASATVVLSVFATLPGVVTDTANVVATEPDPNLANNTSSVVTTLIAPSRIIEFASPSYSARETDGLATITLDRLGDPLGDVTAHFSTVVGDTATPGLDYQPVSVTVDFPPGVSQATVSVPVLVNPFDNHDEFVVLQLDTPTGGATLQQGLAVGTAPITAILDIVDVNPVLVGPTVGDLKLIGPVGGITAIEVDLTGSLDPSTATNALNYTIVALGGVKPGLRAGTVVPVVLATYNAATGAVKLTPAVPLPANELFQVDVNGSRPGAVSDRAGNPLNSAPGVIGSDYILTVARGTNINYHDEKGVVVNLKLTGPGTLDLDRSASGQVQRLQVVGGVARKTVISGSVHSSSRRTNLGSIVGLGRFGSIAILTTPPFYVTNPVYPNAQNLVDAPAVDTLLPPAPKKTGHGVKAKAIVLASKHPLAATAHAVRSRAGR